MNEEIKEVEKEIAKLQDKLAILKSKKSKVWKPEECEVYYFITAYGDIYKEVYIEGCNEDIGRYSISNCYKTKSDAEFALEKQKLLVAMQRYADEHNEEEIDWNNDRQSKYSLNYNYNLKKFNYGIWETMKQFGQIYFTSKEIAENCVKELGKDKIAKYLFGVE